MDRAFQRIRSLMLRGTFYSVPPKVTKPPNGWSYIAKQTEYSVKTSFHSRWIISSVPGLTCNIAFLIISHWRRLSENCAGYIMNKRLSEKYM